MSFLQSPIKTAHRYWKEWIIPGDIVIDATCGNGHDTVFLANCALTSNSGIVYAIDIQSEAIANTRARIEKEVHRDKIKLIQSSHAIFPDEIKPGTVKLIVYNLGYLPGSDKALTTKVETTLESINHAQHLIMEGGVISITCYPGHPEGKKEEEALLQYVEELSSHHWTCTHQRWINRREAPSLLLIHKWTQWTKERQLQK